jgi:hypothetical protein
VSDTRDEEDQPLGEVLAAYERGIKGVTARPLADHEERTPVSDTWYKNPGRAVDDAQKEEITRRLLALWKANPGLRFMQLLGNVFHRGDPYYVEDYQMIEVLEEYYEAFPGVPPVPPL